MTEQTTTAERDDARIAYEAVASERYRTGGYVYAAWDDLRPFHQDVYRISSDAVRDAVLADVERVLAAADMIVAVYPVEEAVEIAVAQYRTVRASLPPDTVAGQVLSAAERDRAIECIAQALSGAYFDFGVGGRDAEVNEGRKIGEHVIDALELWGWRVVPTDDEADAPPGLSHPGSLPTARAVRSARTS